MNLVFGMVASVFDFFVDIGNKVDFMGLDLWQISFVCFIFACVFRWLFPVIFAGEGGVPSGSFISSFADSVKRNDSKKTSSGSKRDNKKK